jgi:hypothetical protein
MLGDHRVLMMALYAHRLKWRKRRVGASFGIIPSDLERGLPAVYRGSCIWIFDRQVKNVFIGIAIELPGADYSPPLQPSHFSAITK